ncbi:MAG: pyridoxal-phosphate dependent enzyme, partial [Candidatus Eisenbacteria bacterium]|nr:pyridoxal-phosphate dependent enzyme [Candidatus Eisenbacteria bacterium]
MSGPSPFNPRLIGFDCPACEAFADLTAARSTCPACAKPLVARYDLERLRGELDREDLARRGSDLWRYRALLPFAADFPAVRLGEGGTPLLPLARLAADLGVAELWLKEESGNPTQSFKARGLALAVSGAVAFGIRAIALPSAGNAGSA